jgi:hypothetical protein
VVVHTCNLSIQETEAEQQVGGQPEIQSKFQDTLGYLARPYLKKTKKMNPSRYNNYKSI